MKRIAIAQVVLGVLIIGSFFAFMQGVYRGYNTLEGTFPGTDNVVRVLMNPGQATLIGAWQFVYLAVGLVVTGCGIALFIKTQREAGN